MTSLSDAVRSRIGAGDPELTDTTIPKPEAKSSRFPCFDGLRAIAAVAVVIVHTAYYSGLYSRSSLAKYTGRLEVGVAIFFVISGFLLYRPFVLAHLAKRPTPALRTFWIRRLLRILPAFWLALTIEAYALHAITMPSGWQGVLTQYGLLQIYFPNSFAFGITQAWSLCTEMSFYLFLPLYAVFIGRRRLGPLDQLARELAGLGTLIAVSVIFRVWNLTRPVVCHVNCFTHVPFYRTMGAWLPSYIDLFALGMFLAVASAWFEIRGWRPNWLDHAAMPWVSWAVAWGAFWAVSNLGISTQPVYIVSPGINIVKQTLYGVVALFLVAPAVFGPQDRGAIRRALRYKPIALLGVISYGVYLWHQAWITEFFSWTGEKIFGESFWVLTGFALTLSIISAGLSYVVVERRALSLKDRLTGRPITPQ